MAAMDVLIQSVLRNLPPEVQQNIVQAVEFLSKVQAQLDRIEAQNATILGILQHGRGNGVAPISGESRSPLQLGSEARGADISGTGTASDTDI